MFVGIWKKNPKDQPIQESKLVGMRNIITHSKGLLCLY